jgi:hypothetical protein
MIDYKNGKIYKLWSPQGTDEEVYYGSTCNDLRFRKYEHKNKKKCSSKILFEKYDDVRIELIEYYPCNNKEELFKKEGEYIRENKCLNRCIAGRTRKEWREDNKEKLTEQRKEYRENNKEKIAEYNANYNREYIKKNKEKRAENKKEWNENNKEKIAKYNREYNLKNKEKNKL